MKVIISTEKANPDYFDLVLISKS